MALADGLESFAGELREAIDETEQKLMEDTMNVYYAAEELIKDPAHAISSRTCSRCGRSICGISGLRFRSGSDERPIRR